MSRDKGLIFLACVVFIAFEVWFFSKSKEQGVEDVFEYVVKLEQQIENLSSTRDSIRTVVDSVHVKIITNEKHYQEFLPVIITQSSNADSVFLSNYARQHYSERTGNNMP